jgi:GxxExxY protein
LGATNLRVEVERRIPVHYKGRRIDHYLKVDLVVEGCIIVEVKSVASIEPVHLAQVITYLKLANCPAGLLMNFNSTTLRAGLRRLNHPDRHRPKHSSRSVPGASLNS